MLMETILIKCALNCSLTKSINPSRESPGLQALRKVVVGEGEEDGVFQVISKYGKLDGNLAFSPLETASTEACSTPGSVGVSSGLHSHVGQRLCI